MELWLFFFTLAGLLTLLVGAILLIIGLALNAIRKRSGGDHDGRGDGKRSGRTRGGGVLLIGPIPIVFGTDRGTVLLAIGAAIFLLVISIILMSMQAST